mmetsp:Transcript_11073/g.22449  ORF Transcript_11073/g.22449 Transcript_11073/m.22449 type:complete len:517 (-) Transcript_11073:77-1627(-)
MPPLAIHRDGGLAASSRRSLKLHARVARCLGVLVLAGLSVSLQGCFGEKKEKSLGARAFDKAEELIDDSMEEDKYEKRQRRGGGTQRTETAQYSNVPPDRPPAYHDMPVPARPAVQVVEHLPPQPGPASEYVVTSVTADGYGHAARQAQGHVHIHNAQGGSDANVHTYTMSSGTGAGQGGYIVNGGQGSYSVTSGQGTTGTQHVYVVRDANNAQAGQGGYVVHNSATPAMVHTGGTAHYVHNPYGGQTTIVHHGQANGAIAYQNQMSNYHYQQQSRITAYRSGTRLDYCGADFKVKRVKPDEEEAVLKKLDEADPPFTCDDVLLRGKKGKGDIYCCCPEEEVKKKRFQSIDFWKKRPAGVRDGCSAIVFATKRNRYLGNKQHFQANQNINVHGAQATETHVVGETKQQVDIVKGGTVDVDHHNCACTRDEAGHTNCKGCSREVMVQRTVVQDPAPIVVHETRMVPVVAQQGGNAPNDDDSDDDDDDEDGPTKVSVDATLPKVTPPKVEASVKSKKD